MLAAAVRQSYARPHLHGGISQTNKRGSLVLLACLLSGSTLAAECLLRFKAQGNPSLTLVAPEMLRPIQPDPYCMSAGDAIASIRTQAAILAASAPGAYAPLTKDDNTPWRFDMSQNGKRMTAAEFDAWMKAKGIRVATGKPTATTPAPASSAPVAGAQ